jgi:hypothetical protein
MGPIERANLRPETEFSLRNVVFLKKRQGDGKCQDLLLVNLNIPEK